tara:strand:- start:10658 stop:10846 length:189 start_codon:yes stop_codon:yes gene_type:complete
LNEGTYISADTYPRMERYMQYQLIKLVTGIREEFIDSNDRKVTQTHVDRAVFKLVTEELDDE